MARVYKRFSSAGRAKAVGAYQRLEPTPTYWNTRQAFPVIDKERPGYGYRHLLRRDDVIRFLEIVPTWNELSHGLDAIVLAGGDPEMEGWYTDGVVGICAWRRGLWRRHPAHYYEENQGVFDRLGVPAERRGDWVLCKFSLAQARAYQLLNILLHELGHHHDRMTTRSQYECSRGEPYAEAYALKYEEIIWERYWEVFGLD